MIRHVWSIVFFAVLVVFAAPVSASPMFTFNHPPGESAGFIFAASGSDFTTEYTASGTGSATAVLGAPDSGFDPNAAHYVDFGGGNPAEAWTVTVGFAAPFGDIAGMDVQIFTTQLNATEGFDLYASGNGTTFTLIGTFVAFNAASADRGSVDVDFNGTTLPAGAQYLRFVGTTVPISSFSYGFDFDAVGVKAAPATVPKPATLALLSFGLALRRRRRRCGACLQPCDPLATPETEPPVLSGIMSEYDRRSISHPKCKTSESYFASVAPAALPATASHVSGVCRSVVRSTLPLVALLLWPLTASADAILVAHVVVGDVDNVQLASGFLEPVEAGLVKGNGVGTGTAHAHATAEYGNLKAFSELDNYGGIAYAGASWSDDFTVTSALWAVGTFVTFRASNDLYGRTSTNNGFDAVSSYGVVGWESAYGETGWTGFGLTGVQGYEKIDEIRYAIGYPSEAYEQTVIRSDDLFFQLQVGHTYSATAFLRAYTTVGAVINGYALAAFGNSAHFHLDPMGEGFSYATASGTDYRTPAAVPVSEPATLLLLGIGLVGAGVRRWRQPRV